MEKIKLCNGLKKRYIIPCFQREYSWEREEIEELIANIKDLKIKEEYCLGIITVKNEKNGESLLIDGQQRLTTLYMIAIWCNHIIHSDDIMILSEYDTFTSKTNNLCKILNDPETNDLPYNLKIGWNIIKTEIKEEEKEKIKEIINENLYYYEIKLDNNMNLNHYFEVMNSRGVQLSRSDIIKSFLMKFLEDEDRSKLNYLWYRYEKMDNKTTIKNFRSIKANKSQKKPIKKILENGISHIQNQNDIIDFEEDGSILNFEYFLLYTIRLYKNRENLDKDVSGEFNLINLVDEYKSTFKNCSNNSVIEFLDFLIDIKNIYDTYLIKYDRINDNWKLESFQNQEMILIQSCLRVSFVNKRLMHWVYKTLAYFYKNKEDNEKNKIHKYIEIMKNYIRKKYIINFINDNEKSKYRTGFKTPNIVLNYLDYLIKDNIKTIINDIPEAKGLKTDEFKFRFRNSIEHFMPRHSNEPWVDDFGNLALLSYGTNTKIQDATPYDKASHFNSELSGYSLKLQIMSKIALDNTKGWNENTSYYITKKCIDILKADLIKI